MTVSTVEERSRMSDLPTETILRAIDGLRAEIQTSRAESRADVQGLRAEMQQGLAGTVDRETHAVELARLNDRIDATSGRVLHLEQVRARRTVGLWWPLAVGVIAALVGAGAGVVLALVLAR
jgi:hypothetical protein